MGILFPSFKYFIFYRDFPFPSFDIASGRYADHQS